MYLFIYLFFLFLLFYLFLITVKIILSKYRQKKSAEELYSVILKFCFNCGRP